MGNAFRGHPGDNVPPSSECADPPTMWVEEYLDDVYAYAYRLAGSHDQAEELTQQTFLVAQQRWKQLRDRSRARAWLLRILRNHFLKVKRRRQPLSASQLDMQVELIAESAPNGNADDEHLQHALKSLPDEFRTVVLMFYFEQLSYRHIANELKLPIGTVMSRLARARQQLRDVIERMDRLAESVIS